jgi:hypothetical protein
MSNLGTTESPPGWRYERSGIHVTFAEEPDFPKVNETPVVLPRIAIDVRYDRGSIAVKYGIPTTPDLTDGYYTRTLMGNYVTFVKTGTATYLEVRYFIEKGGDGTKTLYTPVGLAPGAVIPSGWLTPAGSASHIYWSKPDAPTLLSNSARAAIDAKLKVRFGYDDKVGTVSSVGDPNLALDFDEDDTTMVVYRVYRNTYPSVSVAIITPGGDPPGT